MQKQTQKLFTAFLPRGCSRLLKAQSAAVSEIYLLYFCPKKEYLPLHLPIHCLLMYHSATNPYNQHCINAIFPTRQDPASTFLPHHHPPHPQGKPTCLQPWVTPCQLFPSALVCHSHSPSSSELWGGPRLLFLSQCSPPAWHTPSQAHPRRQHPALVQLWLRAPALLAFRAFPVPSTTRSSWVTFPWSFPILGLCNAYDSFILSHP